MANPLGLTYPYQAPQRDRAEIRAHDYWTYSDGNDIGATVNRAILAGLARYPAGVRVYIPSENYQLATGIVIPADNVELNGDGWGTQITPVSSFTGYMITSQAPGGGVFRYGIRIADLFLNANNQANVNGLDMQTTYHARLEHVRVRFCTGIAIHMDGSGGNVGAYNLIEGCLITDGGAGTGLQTDFSEWLTVIGGTFSFYNATGGVGAKIQNLNCRLIGVAFDNNDTGYWQSFAGRATVVGCQFDRGQTRFIYLQGSQYSLISGNSFNTYNGSAGTGAIDVTDANNAGNVITGNALRGSSGWTNFIDEHGSVGTPANQYANNDTGGAAIVLVSGTARNNRGVNPIGKLGVTPTVPASGTPYVNVTGYDCMVYVLTLGGLTAVSVGGQAIPGSPAVGTVYRVPAGQSITLTWATTAPTWAWWGD